LDTRRGNRIRSGSSGRIETHGASCPAAARLLARNSPHSEASAGLTPGPSRTRLPVGLKPALRGSGGRSLRGIGRGECELDEIPLLQRHSARQHLAGHQGYRVHVCPRSGSAVASRELLRRSIPGREGSNGHTGFASAALSLAWSETIFATPKSSSLQGVSGARAALPMTKMFAGLMSRGRCLAGEPHREWAGSSSGTRPPRPQSMPAPGAGLAEEWRQVASRRATQEP